MREELENKLYQIDPVFFEQAIACIQGTMNEMSTCMAFGCECGDGWFKPLEKFTYKVKFINELAKQYNTKFVCQQLKEKFGELRIYYQCDKIDKNIDNEHKQEINNLIDMFEDVLKKAVDDCWNVCEICGKDGGLNGKNLITTSGWISRICRQCSQQSMLHKTKEFDSFNNQQYIPRITWFKQGYYFLNMFYPTGFDYDNQYYKSIVQAYICIKDPKHKTLYRDIQNNAEKLHSYLNYEAFINFGYQMLQGDYQLIKKITLARFTYQYNKQDLAELLKTKDYKLQNMGRHCNNIYGHCVCDKCKNIQHKDLYAKILTEVREYLLQQNKPTYNIGQVVWKDNNYYVIEDSDVNKQSKFEFRKINILDLNSYCKQQGIERNKIKIVY